MKHIKRVSIAKAMEKQPTDPFGAIFFQIWLTVMSLILSKGIAGE